MGSSWGRPQGLGTTCPERTHDSRRHSAGPVPAPALCRVMGIQQWTHPRVCFGTSQPGHIWGSVLQSGQTAETQVAGA